ncbi:MAG: BACON domain-containing protein [Alistipes sp.]|jgi:hypothetical protein|nr:BACON domain-containing protein [Alistipes sp.]
MKTAYKSFAIALAGMLALGLSACDKSTPEPTGEIILGTETLEFAFAGETKTVTVDTDMEWTVAATEGQNWLTVEKTGDGEFSATAAANPFAFGRQSTVTVTNAKESAIVTVDQEASTEDQGVVFYSGVSGYNGPYYGRQTANFDIILYSEYDAREALKDGYSIELDLAAPAISADGRLDIAPGTYELTYRYAPYTAVIQPVGLTNVIRWTPEGYIVLPATGGKVHILGDSEGYNMVFDLTLADGSRFRGVFNEPLTSQNNVSDAPATKDDLDAGEVAGASVGLSFGDDYFENGAYTWLMTTHSAGVIVGNDGTYAGDGYVLTSQITSVKQGEGAYLPDAMYAVSMNVERAPTVMQGYDVNGTKGGTWLRKIVAGAVADERAVKVGTLTTTLDGDTYTVTLDGVDETGAYIKGTFTGGATSIPWPY